ncbi:MAG TPA: hypothetical protein VIE88_05885, partial [Vicinamibacteria bacterium]
MALALLQRFLGGEAAFQSFDYRLWRGEIRVEGLAWTREQASVRAREVVLRFSLERPLDVRIEEPDVRVVLTGGAPGREVAALPASALAVALTIGNGSLRLEWPEEDRALEIASIDAELRPEGKSSRATVAATSGRLRDGALDIDFGPARANLLLGPTEIQIEEARLSKGASFVAASGKLGPLSPLAGELRFEHSIDASLLSELEPRVAFEGALEGEGALRRTPGSEDQGQGVLRAPSVSIGTMGPLSVEASWRFEGEDANADLTFAGDGAVSRLSSRFSGRFGLAVENWDFENVKGEGLVSLRAPERGGPPGIPLRGDVELRLEGKKLAFAARRLTVPGAEISGSGTLGEVIEGKLRAGVRDIDELTPLLSLAGAPAPASPIPLGGPLDLEGRVHGPLESPSLDARVSSPALTLGSASFTLEGRMGLRGSRLELDDLTLRSAAEGSIVVDGGIPFRASGGSSSLLVRVDDLDLVGVVAPLSSGKLTASLALSGDFSRPEVEASFTAGGLGTTSGLRADARGQLRARGLEGKGEIRLEEVSFGGKGFPGATVALDSDGSTARMKTRLEDGREVLEAEVALRSPYPLEAEIPLQNLPFTEIRNLFPALVDAGMELEASGRGRIEGPLAEPERLRYRVEAERVLGLYRGIALGATSPFVLSGTREGFAVSDLTLVGEDTAIGIDGAVPLSREGGVVLHARGASRLELLRPWFPEYELAGRANVDVLVEGALPDPWLRGEVSLEEASGRFKGVLVENVEVRANWSDRALALEQISGRMLGGSVRASGELPPQLDASAPVRLQFEAFDLEPLRLVPIDQPGLLEEAHLRVAVSGELQGPGVDFSRWQGSGTLGDVR